MSANTAIWIAPNNELEVRHIEQAYIAQQDEALIQVEYSGINPADLLHGHAGFHDYPAGYDFAGVILDVGKQLACTRKVGDRVCGFAAPMLRKPPQYGSHQRYHVARQHSIYLVPSTLPLHIAAAMPVITHTAADAIFNQLRLPFEPSDDEAVPILIWGGSSSVGCAAIQFAKKAGCKPIFVTASTRNHAALLRLGATHCFDYNQDGVVDEIRSAVRTHAQLPLRHVLDAVGSGTGPTSTTALCESCCESPQDTLFTSPLPAGDKASFSWSNVFACRDQDVKFQLPDGSLVALNASKEWQNQIERATKWAVEHYGNGFELPSVVVVQGASNAIRQIKLSAAGGASLQKFVIQHPL